MPNRHAASIGVAFATTLVLSLAVGSATVVGSVATPARPSDFDGDGYADLAIGVPGEDIGSDRDAGWSTSCTAASDGLTAGGDQAWTQDTAGVQRHAAKVPPTPAIAAGDAFGCALASADFDRDGQADLAIGAPLDRVGDTATPAAVNVLYGTSNGSARRRISAGRRTNLAGEPATGDGFGRVARDRRLRRRRLPDLAIGIPGRDHGTDEAPGTVVILYGSAAGLVATDAMDPDPRDDRRGRMSRTRRTDSAPPSAAGDLDGDGFDGSSAISAPASGIVGDDPVRPLVNGEVTVVYGSAERPDVDGSQTLDPGRDRRPGRRRSGRCVRRQPHHR